MSDLIVIATRELIDDFEGDENPANLFPCLPCGPIVRDERAALYATISRLMFEDAIEQEALIRALDETGPYIYALSETVREDLADIDEDQVDDIASEWFDSAGVSDLGFDTTDLTQFLYQFVHFCRTASDDLGIFVFSDN